MKIQEYRAYSAKNQETLQSLLQTETSCRDQGARISGRIATLADALSCEAQKDASQIDAEMTKLGGSCETIFQQINTFQRKILADYESVKSDLDVSLQMMSESRSLQEDL